MSETIEIESYLVRYYVHKLDVAVVMGRPGYLVPTALQSTPIHSVL